MILPEPIETSRLRLRSLRQSDIGDTYLSWMNDAEIVRFLEVRFNGTQSLTGLQAFVDTMNASSNNYMFGIFRKYDDLHIGNIKLGPIIREHARAEIGYLIGDRRCWGKGYASEAIHRVARFGLDELGLKKIKAGCYETNIGSAKALRKAGFDHEATVPLDSICDGQRVASLLFSMNGQK
jgi:RimJ/RimL family protein N-acetyltransferase